MWGERARRIKVRARKRNIPTHVGRTNDGTFASSAATEHPHACGENLGFQEMLNGYGGTSPRMWGEQYGFRDENDARRNIPTHVGRTVGEGVEKRLITEHPHACGENKTESASASVIDGTSPRMWGERGYALQRDLQPRNIPTHVGRTPQSAGGQAGVAEHPHACGENKSGNARNWP